jgi:hypothetical protein
MTLRVVPLGLLVSVIVPLIEAPAPPAEAPLLPPPAPTNVKSTLVTPAGMKSVWLPAVLNGTVCEV